MNEWLTMEFDELLNEAIMSETPMLVVEGIDDISVYEGICSQTGKSVEVVAVQNLKNMSEGNRGVVEFINELYELDFGGNIEDYVLGVIDRDSRFYRGELLEVPALFILKWYSMESHFVTKESIRIIIKQCTRTQEKLITEELIENIYTRAVNNLMSLFYLSLECLKKACVTGYSSVASYKMNIPHLRNLGAFEDVENKKMI